MFTKAHHKLDVSITYDKLWHPMMFEPHIKNNNYRVESCRDCFNWSHFCQLGKSIDYRENDIHSIPFK
jgi:hypothetical protein